VIEVDAEAFQTAAYVPSHGRRGVRLCASKDQEIESQGGDETICLPSWVAKHFSNKSSIWSLLLKSLCDLCHDCAHYMLNCEAEFGLQGFQWGGRAKKMHTKALAASSDVPLPTECGTLLD